MIVFLTLIYVAILALAVKIGIIKLNAFWKVSPVLWLVGLFLVIFVPMQWGAPAGAVNSYQTVIEIIPSVSGEVEEVVATPLQSVKKGDPLFTIDKTQYEAQVEQIEAQIALSEANLARAQEIMDRGVGRQVDIDIYQAEVGSFQSQLDNALWQLEKTIVRAPENGRVAALTLRPGQRVSNMPVRSWVAFVGEDSDLVVGIPQSRLRHVAPGQEVEFTLRMFPGLVIPGTVGRILYVNQAAQLMPSGLLPEVPTATDPAMPYGVVIDFDRELIPEGIVPGGSAGTAAIYTDSMAATHVIRRIMIRMEAWMNYLKP